MMAQDRRWLLQGAGAGVALLLAGTAGYLARAESGGATGETLSYSGVLTGVPDGKPVPLEFTFYKTTVSGASVKCSALPSKMGTVTPSNGGAFQTDLVLKPECAGFFDGSEITYKITLNNEVLDREFRLSSVPYAKFADQAGTPECPAGYGRVVEQRRPEIIVCKKGADEVVRVGTGKTAFWIDRYEASVWGKDANGEKQYGAADANYPGLAPSGQWWKPGMAPTPPLYAQSRAGVTPSSNVTWFQAQELCAASGKQLLSRKEWFLAVQGTPDPVAGSAGDGGTCVTAAGGPRSTGGGVQCESAWGVQDMIGNLWELTDEWYAGVGDSDLTLTGGNLVGGARQPWPTGYDGTQSDDKMFTGDGTWNVRTHVIGAVPINGIPAVASRGGYFGNGPRSGVFAISLDSAPSSMYPYVGFRCSIPR